MTVKEELIQALEQVSETELVKVLEFVQSLKSNSTQSEVNPVWQAYLASEREREEVYRRLHHLMNRKRSHRSWVLSTTRSNSTSK